MSIQAPAVTGDAQNIASYQLSSEEVQLGVVCYASGSTPTPVTSANRFPVDPGTVAVTGTFWQATQPISASALPLPSGAATSANQTTGNASLATLAGAVAGTEVQVDVLTMPTVAVTGTFYQAIQPISASSLPLPSGAATETTLSAVSDQLPVALSGGGRLIVDAVGTVAISNPTIAVTDNGGSLTVDGTFWQTTQPISASELPLPAGAATAAKQPALGTAGTAASDVISVQGIASMTPLLVNGSGVTQPVSWSGQTVAATQSGTWDIGTVTTITNVVNVRPASPAAADYLPVRLTNGTSFYEASGGGGGGTYSDVITASVTRPADTSAYAAGDAISDSTSSPTVLTFTGCARTNGGTGSIVRLTMIHSVAPTVKPQIELWIFDTAPTAVNDNAAWAPSDSDAQKTLAVVPLNFIYVGDSATGGNTVYLGYIDGPIVFKCAGGSTALYGVPVIRNAITPASASVFTFRMGVAQD